MVVGSNKPSSSRAYIYEFDGTEWVNTFTLRPDSGSVYPLPFYPTLPIVANYPNTHDGFGHGVAMFGDTVMVGAPYDRIVQEFASSSLHQQSLLHLLLHHPLLKQQHKHFLS